jgi:signal transduction histidine kinase
VARVRSQSLQLYPSEVDLAPLVESIALDMAKDSRRHTLRTELSAAPRVRADEERLSLVLRNMIESAFRSARHGTTLTVLLTQHDGDAEIGFRYEPLPLDELAAEPAGSFDLARSVDETLVTALGGTLAADRGPVETTEWVRLPVG